MFNKTLTLLAGFAAAALAPALAPAQQAPASPHTLTGNVGLFSQYIFRGLTQTNKEPALQGGFDYSHASGFYAGTWASNISWLRDGGAYNAGGSLEWDFYGGYKGSIGKTEVTYDIGLLYYWYPGDVTPGCALGAVACPRANTTEIYGALGWKWFTLKYSHSIDKKTFGVPNSRGTYYLDLTASVPLGNSGFTAIAHWGKQKYDGQIPGLALSNDTLFSYEDWKIGLSYALPKDFTIGVFYTDTSGANPLAYGSVAEGGAFPRNIAKGTGTVYIQKTF
ncbi:MAG TPA: TorF family putative porin [Burkholderiales bacterium]|nr:TorF family putative porin [Burkholderiales bacterium]